MKTVAIYARVSSEQQSQQATIDSQIAALRQRVELDGHAILPQDMYVDDGFSGATLVRPALERLRDRAAEGAVDILYVHSPDRLSRKYAYQVLLLEELRGHGVTTIFVNGPAGQSAEDELLVQVQGMIAEYERAKIMERCRRGKLHRAREGSVNPMSGAPYGYLYVKKTESSPAAYRILLPEAKNVRRIFHSIVRDQKSIGQVVRELNADQVPTRKGAKRWDRATVWGILKNPAYMGKAAFGKTEVTERRRLLRPIRGKDATPRRAKSTYRDKPADEWIYVDVPAIVSQDIFEAAKAQLERNKALSSRNGRGQKYLLQGLTVCACCGYALYGKTVSKSAAKGGKQYAYYRCVGGDAYRFAGGRICDNPQVRVDQLDGYVWDSVRELLQQPRRVMEEWTRRSEEEASGSGELRQQRDEAERILRNHERALQRLVDAYEAGVLELDELKKRSEAVRARIRTARGELAGVQNRLQETVELHGLIARLEDFASHVHDGLDRLPWLDRRQLVRMLVARVDIEREGANIVFRVPAATGPGADGSPPEPGSAPSRKNEGSQKGSNSDLGDGGSYRSFPLRKG